MEQSKAGSTAKPTRPPAPHAPDALSMSEHERRAARSARAGGRPLWPEETAPGERGDGPYGDSEPGRREERPGV